MRNLRIFKCENFENLKKFENLFKNFQKLKISKSKNFQKLKVSKSLNQTFL